MKPGESLTLTFSEVIKVTPDDKAAHITVTPIKCNVYSIRPLGKGPEPYEVTAK